MSSNLTIIIRYLQHSHHYPCAGLDPQVLVITERFALDERPRWKFPGGLVQPGESLGDAVAREVGQGSTGFAI